MENASAERARVSIQSSFLSISRKFQASLINLQNELFDTLVSRPFTKATQKLFIINAKFQLIDQGYRVLLKCGNSGET